MEREWDRWTLFVLNSKDRSFIREDNAFDELNVLENNKFRKLREY